MGNTSLWGDLMIKPIENTPQEQYYDLTFKEFCLVFVFHGDKELMDGKKVI